MGALGEAWARQMYERRGYRIVDSNVFNHWGKRLGEIDFIAVGPRYIVFVEVKTRALAVSRFGTGLEAVDGRKQRRLLAMSRLFLSYHGQYQKLQPRIDVCVVICGLDKRPQRAIIILNAVDDSD